MTATQPKVGLSPLSDGMWFIADAAFALAEQEGLTVTGRQDLYRRMGECAGLAADHPQYLRTRNIESKVPMQQEEADGLALGVYPGDVNAWLTACGTPYRWSVQPVRFDIPVRMLEIPPALIAMPADQVVYFIEAVAGRKTEGHMVAGDLVEMLKEKAARQRDGWFEIEEAAQLLEDAGRGQSSGWRDKLAAAARAGALSMHEPGSLERIEYGNSRKSSSRPVRTVYDLAHVDDVNSWLDANEPRLPFRFDRPAPHATPAQEPMEYQALLPVAERYVGPESSAAIPTPGPTTPVPRQRAQENAILAKLEELGFTPTALPRPRPGEWSEAKKAVKDALNYSPDVMKKAWQRLRAGGRIKEAPGP